MAKELHRWCNRLTLLTCEIHCYLVFILLTGSLYSFEAEAATEQPVTEPVVTGPVVTEPAVKTRLNGTDGHQGVIEHYDPLSRSWLPFCGNMDPDDRTAAGDVACRELGFHGAQDANSTVYFSEGGNYTAYINIRCVLSDGIKHSSLGECYISGTGDATRCDQLAITVTCLTTRLTGGDDHSEGRVEVWSNGNWGKVCSPGFGANEQTVVCRELGYTHRSNRTLIHSANQFQDLHSPYMWGSVSCTGSEPNLLACNPTTTAPSSCAEADDAYAVCSNTLYTQVYPKYAVRLADGPCNMEGRLEVFDGSDWGTVCQDMFTEKDATVVCRQLGMRTVSAEVVPCCDTYPKARERYSVVLGTLNCTGSEIMITDCLLPPLGSTVGCSTTRHTVDVGVRCQTCPTTQGVNIGAVIGGAIAAFFILIVIGVVVWYVCCIPTSKYHKRQSNEPENDDEDDDDNFREEATPDDPMLADDLKDEDLRERTTEIDTGV